MHVVRAQVLLALRAVAKDIDADFRPVLRRLKLQEKDLEREGVYIRAQTLNDVYESCAADWQLSNLGLLVGDAADISEMGALALALTHATSGRDGLRIAQNAMNLINSHWRVFVSSGPHARTTLIDLRSAFALTRPSMQLAERAVLSALRRVQLVVDSREPPKSVWLKHAPLSSMATYRAAFGVTPEFNMPARGLILRDSFVDRANPRGNTRLRNLAEDFLKAMRPVPSDDLVAQVRAICDRALSVGKCSQNYVAAQLGVQPRTLQRRLNQRDTTFDQVRDEARRITAERFLPRLDVDLSTLAGMLGYTDQRALNRSCHRWFGASPSAIRKRSLRGRPISAAVVS